MVGWVGSSTKCLLVFIQIFSAELLKTVYIQYSKFSCSLLSSFEACKHGWCLPRFNVMLVIDWDAVTTGYTVDGNELTGTTHLLCGGAGLAVAIVGVHSSCYLHQLFCTYGLYSTPITKELLSAFMHQRNCHLVIFLRKLYQLKCKCPRR